MSHDAPPRPAIRGVREAAAAWRPQRPGRRAPRDLREALVEPDWGGVRVVAALTADEVELYKDGTVVQAPQEVLEALLDGFTGIDAVVEGHLTTDALRTSEGAFPVSPNVERPPILLPRLRRADFQNDPYIHGRDHELEVATLEPQTLEALERGERHAFVATDLLWLDGQPITTVPLLERKRLLEAVLGESFLVRVSAFVRPSSEATLISWGSLGFKELSYRASNSRYLMGAENPDWAIARAPQTPSGALKGPSAR